MRPSWLPCTAADLKSTCAGRPCGVQSILGSQPRALRCKKPPVTSGQHCLPLLHGIPSVRRPRRSENSGRTFVKWSQLPHIQAILFATISGCTISGADMCVFARPRKRHRSQLTICAHENGPRFEAERAFPNCPVSGHKARRHSCGHRESVISRAPLTV